MIPARFDYLRAATLAEAIDLLGRHPGAKVLAGGHSLIPMMKLRLAQPPSVVDVGRLSELRGIGRTSGGGFAIGALTTHAEIAASPELESGCPLLAAAAARIADPAVRNRATIGGNIAHADPASDLPAVLVALDASIHLAGPQGEREIAAGAFFLDLLTTDIRDGEVLTRVEVRPLPGRTGTRYLKQDHPASGFAVCGAAAIVTLGADGSCTSARLAFNGVTATPLDAVEVCAALVGTPVDDTSLAAALARLRVDEPLGDVHASGAYRAHLAGVIGRRALAQARDRA